MATYLELKALYNDDELFRKMEVAVAIAADTLIRSSTPTAAEKDWAAFVLGNPREEAKKAMISVLAANNGLSVSAIQGASDSAIQTQVNSIVPKLVDAKAGI